KRGLIGVGAAVQPRSSGRDEESRLDSRSYKRGLIGVGAAVQPRSSGRDEESRLDSRSYKRGRIDVGAAVQPRSSGLAKSRDWTVAPTSGGASGRSEEQRLNSSH